MPGRTTAALQKGFQAQLPVPLQPPPEFQKCELLRCKPFVLRGVEGPRAISSVCPQRSTDTKYRLESRILHVGKLRFVPCPQASSSQMLGRSSEVSALSLFSRISLHKPRDCPTLTPSWSVPPCWNFTGSRRCVLLQRQLHDSIGATLALLQVAMLGERYHRLRRSCQPHHIPLDPVPATINSW